ncbi:MAG TPA: septal ring lytic transglycosylase RlpA family protein, partial [Bacteroidota bacterium]|nr:septal ring lytic transglycosylase RlpA family protein [Bacteroidota bacterium]
MSIYRPSILHFVLLLLCGILVAGCATSPRFVTRSTSSTPAAGEGKSNPPADQPKSGNPARETSGRVLLTLEGIASYYADDYNGKQTSNGEVYNMNDLTAAHRTFPFGTKVRVTNLENKKTVEVRVNDRGPFKEGRMIDLSLAAAKELDLIRM